MNKDEELPRLGTAMMISIVMGRGKGRVRAQVPSIFCFLPTSCKVRIKQ